MSGHLHQPGVFWRLDEATIQQLLKSEGWAPQEATYPAGYVHPIHQHPADKMIAVLHGGMEVKIGQEMYRCLAGDKLFIPGGTEHAAMTGPDGCTYLWSEQVREQP